MERILGTTWGGDIELAVLSAHFRTMIWCWDVAHGVCHKFGEGHAYPRFWMLAYSGIHYDVMECGGETTFASEASAAYEAAGAQLVRKLHEQH